jgi:TPR repeat protein
MGVSYFNGVGVGVDKAESLKWYRLAAEQGIAKAQLNLGFAYFKGEGVSVDKVEGLKWIKLAAENGSQEAISFLKSYQQLVTLRLTLLLTFTLFSSLLDQVHSSFHS